MTLTKTIGLRAALLPSAALLCALALSCTADPQYTLSKENIDTGVTLFGGGLSVPVGSTKEVRLDDVIKTTPDENTLIKLHEDGTFWVDICTSRPAGTDIYVPSPDFSAFDLGITQAAGHYDFPESVVGRYKPTDFTDKMSLNARFPIRVATTAPEGICGIDDLDTDARIGITFGCERGCAYTLVKGSKVEFPDYLTMEVDGDGASITDGHILTLLKDVKVTSSSTLTIIVKHIDVTKLQVSTNSAGRLVITIDDTAKVDGSVEVRGADYGTVPAGFDVLLGASSDRVKVNAITARFDFRESIPVREISLTGIPDYLADAEFLLCSPVFSASVDNATPLALDVVGDIVCTSAGDKVSRYKVESFSIAPEAVTEYRLEGEPAREISRRIPNSIKLENVFASTDKNATIHVEAGRNCRVTVNEYAFRAPLAFAAGAGVKLQTTVEDVNVNFKDLSIADGNAALEFDLVSTLPMDLKIAAEPLDAAGQVIPGLKFSISDKIAAGTIASPSTTPVRLEITASGNSDITVSQIRLDLDATVPASCEGNALCKDNYVKLNNIRIKFPKGVTI